MVRLVTPLAASSRSIRRPQHTFQIRQHPFAIQPFMLAPVLPGETMKTAMIQARVVSDPILNPLVGWWYEMYLFYVRHSDMPDAAHFQNMVLQFGYDMAPVIAPQPEEQHYAPAGGIDWVDQCLRSIVPHYFRDEDEPYNLAWVGDLPAAKINSSSWLDSFILESQFPQGQSVPTGTTPGAQELLLNQWNLMRELKLTTQSYEDFLASYGVRPELAKDEKKPELIRYVRDWSYPSNTVNPANGQPATAMSWSVSERADKDRYFAEPGFIFGVSVARPKVYFGAQRGSLANYMMDAMTWLPAVMADNPETSLKKFAAGTGPVPDTSEPYWVDCRDLFLHGDQFLSLQSAAGGAHSAVALPAGDNRKYAPEQQVFALFKDPAGANTVRCDGICSLQIAGAQQDRTATTAVTLGGSVSAGGV